MAGKEGEFTITRLLTGAAASCGAVFFSNPVEVVKTRMQLQVCDRSSNDVIVS
jgi:hypothetical protein